MKGSVDLHPGMSVTYNLRQGSEKEMHSHAMRLVSLAVPMRTSVMVSEASVCRASHIEDWVNSCLPSVGERTIDCSHLTYLERNTIHQRALLITSSILTSLDDGKRQIAPNQVYPYGAFDRLTTAFLSHRNKQVVEKSPHLEQQQRCQ